MTNSRFCLRFVWAVYVLWFQSPSAMCNQSPSPFGYSLLGLRGRVFVWYSLKLLRFCKEEVSRSDGGDSANALFVFGRTHRSAPTVGVVVPRYCRGRPACLPFIVCVVPFCEEGESLHFYSSFSFAVGVNRCVHPVT